MFDQAVRQGTSFKNFGEFSAGLVNDGRPTFKQTSAGQDFGYPFHFGCDGTAPSTCSTDSGHPGQTGDPKASRFDHFQQAFNQWLVGGDHVPSFVYLTLPNDHTNGVAPGKPTPKALIADNDLGLGQLVQLISHSSIWKDSAIFVIEDDSQDGADHIDAHRMPAFVISPYAKAGAVVHTRYDQYSALRTVGAHARSAPAGAHRRVGHADVRRVHHHARRATVRRYPTATVDHRAEPVGTVGAIHVGVVADLSDGSAAAQEHQLALSLPFDKVDLVPQELSDQVLWHSVYGWDAVPPGAGPDASPDEHGRALVALNAFHERRDITDALELVSTPDSDGG